MKTNTVIIPENYRLIEKNQLVGWGNGAVFRNLYENEEGDRISVHTSFEFWMEKERINPDGTLRPKYPPKEILFQKYRF